MCLSANWTGTSNQPINAYQCWSSIQEFGICIFFSELCIGKAMVAYTKPQEWKKEESERPREEGNQIKFIDLGFERWQAVRLVKARGRQDVP